jgi:hypothetical protein
MCLNVLKQVVKKKLQTDESIFISLVYFIDVDILLN